METGAVSGGLGDDSLCYTELWREHTQTPNIKAVNDSIQTRSRESGLEIRVLRAWSLGAKNKQRSVRVI